MANGRKAELTGMQDPFYPRDPDHVSRLSVVDPELAYYLSAIGPQPREAEHAASAIEWKPSDPEAFFRGLGYDAIVEPGATA